MSLQVQSSQQPSGRRTPQIYQNFGTGTGATSPSNGNSKTPSSKLSLKAASEKPSAAPATTESAVVGVKDPAQTLVLSLAKLPDESNSSSKATAANNDNEKAAATNGSSANGTHTEKATNGSKAEETTLTPVKTVSDAPKKEDEKEKKVKQSPRSTPQKQSQSEQESPASKDTSGKKAKEPPSPITPDQKKKEKPSVENSLVTEKALKGFTAEGEEMESLVVEASEYEDSPMPPRTGGKSKLLKYGSGPLARARISPFRMNEATRNASTAVNLSTVSEGQTSAPESNEPSPVVEYNRPLRTISGRRSTRPLTDIQLTYRRSAELNDSTSSLNVTIGSEIHNDSLRTPVPGSSRKRKAMTPESTSDALDVKEIVDSPKRGRLDFSGFLGIVASPVTMLKNRFSRVKLQASTPVAKRNFVEENLNPGEVVTAEATTTTANISGEDAKMEVEVIEGDKAEELAKATGDGGDDKTQQHAAASDNPSTVTETKDDGSGDGSEPVVVKDVTNKRQFCIIM